MTQKTSLREQIRRNLVALISLAVAVTSLGYNTWRNEASEYNRNQRLVSIELLLMLGDLQQLTNERHYGKNMDGGALVRAGWARVLTIRDIAEVAAGGVPVAAEQLYEVWNADYDLLGSDVRGKERIIAALEDVRAKTHEVLRSLD